MKIKILVILICALFLLLFLYLLFSKKIEKFDDIKAYDDAEKYSFIHIPKTSGLSIKKFITNYSDYFNYLGHEEIAATDNNPIVVLREPLDRFISFFKYWKQNCVRQNKCNDDTNGDWEQYLILSTYIFKRDELKKEVEKLESDEYKQYLLLKEKFG